MGRSGRPIQVYLSEESRERLQAVADANRRPLSEEVRVAIDRYLDNPDVVRSAEVSTPRKRKGAK
jgi:hypothetical protein